MCNKLSFIIKKKKKFKHFKMSLEKRNYKKKILQNKINKIYV